jgi:hypothetical protein
MKLKEETDQIYDKLLPIMYAEWTILLHGVPYALHPLTADLA